MGFCSNLYPEVHKNGIKKKASVHLDGVTSRKGLNALSNTSGLTRDIIQSLAAKNGLVNTHYKRPYAHTGF